MKLSKEQAIIESMLFAAGREVSVKELMNVLELGAEDIDKIIVNLKSEYDARNSGIEIIKVEDSYQLCTRKEYYEYIYPLFDNRAKPNISGAALVARKLHGAAEVPFELDALDEINTVAWIVPFSETLDGILEERIFWLPISCETTMRVL